MTKLCFDIDCLIFSAVSVMEEKFISVTHKPTGRKLEFATRTELWGEWRKKIGGWVGTQNALSKSDYYKAEDFEVVDGQRLRPFILKGKDGAPDKTLSALDGAKKLIDDKIIEICAKLKTGSYFGYTGRGDVFRHEVATLLPYKGNREGRPLLLDEIKDYVCEKHHIELVEGIEADDACNIATVQGYDAWIKSGKNDKYKVIQVAVDKDTKGNNGWHYNPDKDDAPRLIEGFGKLWLTEKDEVDGCGRLFFYWQVLHGDDTDNYKSNCFSDKKYGGKGAYKDLKDCTNDKEAFTMMVDRFKWMYPEKKIVEGCKGPVEIDHMYVMQEMATMAMMLRKPGDKIDVKAVCTKLGVNYE